MPVSTFYGKRKSMDIFCQLSAEIDARESLFKYFHHFNQQLRGIPAKSVTLTAVICAGKRPFNQLLRCHFFLWSLKPSEIRLTIISVVIILSPTKESNNGIMSNLRITQRAKTSQSGSAFDSTNIDSILVSDIYYSVFYPRSQWNTNQLSSSWLLTARCALAATISLLLRKLTYLPSLTARVSSNLVLKSSSERRQAPAAQW